MKRIKKINPRAAQSVFSFACPCIGECAQCMWCACPGGDWSLLQSTYYAASNSISLLAQYGTQTVNYN